MLVKKSFFVIFLSIFITSICAQQPSVVDIARDAVEHDNATLVEEYLTKGLTPNIVFDTGYTALMTAAIVGSLDVARLLLKHPHIDVNHRDVFGNTALHYAAALCDLPMVKLLVAHKNISINQRNTDDCGKTPLMLAVNSQPYTVIPSYEYMIRDNTMTYQVIKVLVFAGANAAIQDNEGNKAIDYTNNEMLKKLLVDPTIYIEKHSDEFQSIDEWYQQACPEKAHQRALQYNKLSNRIRRRFTHAKEQLAYNTWGARIKNKYAQVKTKVKDFFA